jgi:hypothetical protein
LKILTGLDWQLKDDALSAWTFKGLPPGPNTLTTATAIVPAAFEATVLRRRAVSRVLTINHH